MLTEPFFTKPTLVCLIAATWLPIVLTFQSHGTIVTSNSVCRYGGDYNQQFGKCIRNMFSTNYQQAKSSCAVLNGALPCVRSYDQNEAILSRFNGFGCANDHAAWLANNNSDLSCKSNFLYWEKDAPVNGNCAKLTADGNWIREDCSTNQLFVCLYDVFWACSDGWYFYKNFCYYVASFGDTQIGVDQVTAAGYCQKKYNASLVSILTGEENDFLISLVRTIYPNGKFAAWIGFESQNGINYTWLDKKISNYTNWAFGEPLNLTSTSCTVLALYPDYGQIGQWYTYRCHDETEPTFICKSYMKS